jgi:hypothetical protein
MAELIRVLGESGAEVGLVAVTGLAALAIYYLFRLADK